MGTDAESEPGDNATPAADTPSLPVVDALATATLDHPATAAVDQPATAAVDAPATATVDAPATATVVDVDDLDWNAVRAAVDAPAIRARMLFVVQQMEALLDAAGGAGLLFDGDREHADDRAIRVGAMDTTSPLWIVGDLHGDLLALEAALALIRRASSGAGAAPRLVFLGDFFDDEGFGLEVLLRVFELIVEAPASVCVVAGNHDEALGYDGVRFTSTVAPSDFADFLNAHPAHEWIERAGKLAVRLIARSPRALFLPDGLLVAHGGFPLADLHPRLVETGDWNDPACLSDFVWSRLHPKARRKMPNRFSRGSQFGHEDFADFCALSRRLGRPVTHMVRGHDHPDERYAVHAAYAAHPVLTTVALSRRLGREAFGPYERVPTVARFVAGALPQVHRLHVPAELIRACFPAPP